jgi:hypothetical protein
VSPVNNFGSSLWKQVEIQIASDIVGNSNWFMVNKNMDLINGP